MHLPYSLPLHLQILWMPPCSRALDQSRDGRRRRLALLEWQHERGGAAVEVAPPIAACICCRTAADELLLVLSRHGLHI
jgi:hypothetical protein